MPSFLLMLPLGILAGIISGLIPGIHSNLLAVLATTLLIKNQAYGTSMSIFLLSMAITHTFLDALPSVYLGAPDEATAITTLPAHRLVLEGKGHEAMLLSLMGSALGLLLTIIFFFPYFWLLPKLLFLKKYFPFTILFFITLLILQAPRKLISFIFLCLAGLLGWFTLANTTQPFFHLFSGFYGIAMLLQATTTLPEQKDFSAYFQVNLKEGFKATLAGALTSFFPGITNSISSLLFRIKNPQQYIVFVSGINTSSMLFSLATLAAIHKARNGVILIFQKLPLSFSTINLLYYLLIALITGSCAILLGLWFSKRFIELFQQIPYSIITKIIIGFLFLLSTWFDKLFGITCLLLATCLGWLSNYYSIERRILLGALLLPLLGYYFF